MKTVVSPGIEGKPGNLYKDVDGTMLLKTNRPGVWIRCVKQDTNQWCNMVIQDGTMLFSVITGSKGQREVCNQIDAYFATEVAA